MKKIAVILLGLLAFVAIQTPAFAKSYGSKSYSVSGYTAPRYNSNPRYVAPRSQIYVPKTQPVKSYFKSNGTYVQSYNRAPVGSLKLYYNPSYRKPLR